MPHDHRPARDWPIPPMDKGSGHKDTAFTWAMGQLILQRIMEGDTMKAITADPRMPAYCTVFQWMRVVPEFGMAVAELRRALAKVRQSERDAHRLVRRDQLRRRRRRRPRGPSQHPGGSAQALDRLLAQVRDGASVSEAVATPGAPSFKMLYTRLRRCPGFRAAFVDACDWRNAWLGFQIELVPDEVEESGLTIPEANAKIHALKARRGRLTPKHYRAPPPGC